MANHEVAVALAVVSDDNGRVLIGRRNRKAHQGGLLEFPGGKIEPGETPAAAMVRELREETGLVARDYQPLITIPHDYAADGGRVRLFVFSVTQWDPGPSGITRGWRWVDGQSLSTKQFPAANVGVLNALKLPATMMITATLRRPLADILARCERAIESGVSLICLRDPQLPPTDFQQVSAALMPELHRLSCEVIVNCAVDLPVVALADGLHLTSQRLLSVSERPLPTGRWCSAACHDANQLQRAAALGIDFATLSPVLVTDSHPAATPLGWQKFAELVAEVAMPVFALGGMQHEDLLSVRRQGGQGIAGIGLFDSL